jgi:hypothetical protein
MTIYQSDNTYYVYQYLREDGTPYYIGKGKDGRAYSKNRRATIPPIERIELVKENMTEDDALAYEIELIAKYGRKDIGTGILRNLTDGGEGTSGRVYTDATRHKMSGVNSGMYGKTHTDETKQILRESCIKHNETFWTEENRLKHSALKSGINNGMYGKTHTDENKRLISERMSGEDNPNAGGLSDEHKKNLSLSRMESGVALGSNNPNYGKKHSDEAKARMAAANKRPTSCLKCRKVLGSPATFVRYHVNKNCQT